MVRGQTKNGVYQKVDTVGFQADTEKSSNVSLEMDQIILPNIMILHLSRVWSELITQAGAERRGEVLSKGKNLAATDSKTVRR